MEQVQRGLEFQIETPNDQELARRFADHRREQELLNKAVSQYTLDQQAKRERHCEGIEISDGTGLMSGCGAKDGKGFGDCPSCGG